MHSGLLLRRRRRRRPPPTCSIDLLGEHRLSLSPFHSAVFRFLAFSLPPPFVHWPSPFPPFIPLITPSFPIPRRCPPAAVSHINIFHSQGCQPGLEDRWMMMNSTANRISPPLFGRLVFHTVKTLLSLRLMRMCFFGGEPEHLRMVGGR